MSRSINLYLEVIETKKEAPESINPRLSPKLLRYAKRDPGLTKNINATLATLERDAMIREKLRLNKT